MIDAHTHLTDDSLWEKRFAMIDEFTAVGGTGLVTVGMDKETNKRVIVLCEEVEQKDLACLVKCTVGRHPSEVISGKIPGNNLHGSIHDLNDILHDYENHVVAIGECGVDLHYDNSKKVLLEQQQLFALQCQLALERGLPIVIHSRDAFDETCVVLKDFPGVPFYFHCWGYGPKEVDKVMESFPGSYIGFCGNVTYKKADTLRDSLLRVPETQLLLETDAPYLTPQAVRGEKNKPSYVSHTYDFVADFLQKDKDVLAKQVTTNFQEFYSI